MRPSELPGNRWVFGAVLVNSMAEFSAWITVLVVAFEQGGSASAGLAVTVQLVPAAMLAPIVAAAGDRFPRHRVLVASFATQAAAACGVAIAAVTGSPLGVLYVFAAIFTVATIGVPATVASLLVHHARTPIQLMQWNVRKSVVRAVGSLSGPLLTAIVLAVSRPETVFTGLAVICAATALLTGLRLPRDDRLPSTLSLGSVVRDAWRGVVYTATTPGPRRIVAFVGTTEMLIGALDLVFVAVAFDQLGRGGSATALMTVAFSAGTLLAAVVASRRLGWRLSRLTTLGAALMSLPLLLIGETHVFVAVLALTALLGAGSGFNDIGTQTLLQRSCVETMTSRAFGARDSIALIAAAIGAAIAGRLVDDGDLTSTLVMLGVLGALVLVGGSLLLRATERSLRSADPALVACLRSVSFMASLPQPTLERLARIAERRSAPTGSAIVAEGDHGDEFFVVMSGEAEVRVGTEAVRLLTAPASFGEVALLHDTPRTATVTPTTPCELAVIRKDDFLDAISRTGTSHRGALDIAGQHRRSAEPS